MSQKALNDQNLLFWQKNEFNLRASDANISAHRTEKKLPITLWTENTALHIKNIIQLQKMHLEAKNIQKPAIWLKNALFHSEKWGNLRIETPKIKTVKSLEKIGKNSSDEQLLGPFYAL